MAKGCVILAAISFASGFSPHNIPAPESTGTCARHPPRPADLVPPSGLVLDYRSRLGRRIDWIDVDDRAGAAKHFPRSPKSRAERGWIESVEEKQELVQRQRHCFQCKKSALLHSARCSSNAAGEFMWGIYDGKLPSPIARLLT